MLGYLESLLAVVGLSHEQVVDVDPETLCVEPVECVLGVDDGSDAAHLLCLGNCMDGEGGFTRRFRAVYFDDAPAGIASDAECIVEAYRTGGDDFDVFDRVVAELHYGTTAKVFLDFAECLGQCLAARCLRVYCLVFCFLGGFFCHYDFVFRDFCLVMQS